MKLGHPVIIRTVVPFLLLCGLGLLVVYDGARQGARVPELFQYLPSSAPGFIYVPSLERAWRGLAPHLDGVFGNSNTEIAALVRDLRTKLADACLFPNGPEDLARYGLDSNGDVVVAASFPWEKEGLIMALSVRDSLLFASHLAGLVLKNGFVELSAPTDGAVAGNEVRKFRVRRATAPEYGRLCSRHSLVGREFLEIHAKNGEASLTFVPDWLSSGRLQIVCTAIYDNGSEKPCACVLSTGDFSTGNETSDCASEITIHPKKEKSGGFTPHFIQIAGRSIQGITLPDSTSPLVFPEPGIALFASDHKMLVTALDMPAATLDLHRNSNRLFQAFSMADSSGHSDEFLLYGGARPPGVFGAQTLAFRAQGDRERLRFDISSDILRPQVGVVARLISSTGQTPDGVTVLDASQASLLLNELRVSYFVKYLNSYVEGFSEGVEKRIGNFAIVLSELEQMESIDGIGLHLVGLREGFPELVLVMHFRDAAETERAAGSGRTAAYTLIRKVQEKLRLARDREILESALDRYKEKNGNYPISIEDLVRQPEAGIVEEPDSTWLQYSISENVDDKNEKFVDHKENIGCEEIIGYMKNIDCEENIDCMENIDCEDIHGYKKIIGYKVAIHKEINDPDRGLPAALFEGAQYQENGAGEVFHYLLPPITDNDFAHRFEEEFDETDRKKLKDNDSRLCATYIDDTNQMLIGTDAETLRAILTGGLQQQEAELYARLRAESANGLQPKIAIFLRPNWLVDQGAVHPDDEIKEDTRLWLKDFSQYDAIMFTLDARKDGDGIFTTIEFRRQ